MSSSGIANMGFKKTIVDISRNATLQMQKLWSFKVWNFYWLDFPPRQKKNWKPWSENLEVMFLLAYLHVLKTFEENKRWNCLPGSFPLYSLQKKFVLLVVNGFYSTVSDCATYVNSWWNRLDCIIFFQVTSKNLAEFTATSNSGNWLFLLIEPRRTNTNLLT